MKKICFIPFMLILMGAPLTGNDYLIDFFTSREGLVHDQVKALFQDDQGYLWVGTGDGVCRFDGRRFYETPGPKGSTISLGALPDGRIYAVSASTLHFFQDGRFVEVWSDPDATVTRSLVDGSGRIWLASGDRLIRVDALERIYKDPGKDWPSRRVSTLYMDASGGFWVGFRQGGLTRYEEEEDRWITYGYNEGLPSETINDIFQDAQGRLWVGTLKGAAYLEGNVFTGEDLPPELTTSPFYRIFQHQGKLMFAGTRGILIWDGETITRWDTSTGLAGNLAGRIFQDGDSLFLGGSKGISLIDRKGFRIFNEQSGMSSNRVSCFFKDQQGGLWVGTGFGLNRLEKSLFTIWSETDQQGVPNVGSMVRSIVTDEAGNLWFPSREGLGMVAGDGYLKKFTTGDGLPSDRVHLVDHVGNVVWIGTDKGLASYENGQWRRLDHPQAQIATLGLTADYGNRLWFWNEKLQLVVVGGDQVQPLGVFENLNLIHPIEDGSVWLKSPMTLMKFDQNLELVYQERDPVFNNDGVMDDHGVWWFETDDGLMRWEDGVSTMFPSPKPGYSVASIFIGDANELWLNMRTDNGDRDVVRIQDGEPARLSSDAFFLTDRLSSVFVEDDQTTWLLSRKGVSRVDGDRLFHLSVTEGLAGSWPDKLIRDEDGVLWIATNGGLNMYRNGMIAAFSSRDGLREPQITDMAQDAGGRIWVRTAGSVASFAKDQEHPRLELVSVMTGGQSLSKEPGLVLKPRQNDLTFTVRAIDLSRGAPDVRFSYVLEGEDNSWKGNTREESIPFYGLASGSYRFTVTANNRFLSQSEPVSLEFEIMPPVWQRSWFLFLCLLGLIVPIWAFQSARLKRRLEKSRIFNELQTARRMQLSLMPDKAPKLEGYRIFGVCVPANEVGGDYYDYFWLEEDKRLGLAILDVSGKSMGAAMIAVMNSGLINAEAGTGYSPAAILSRMNYPNYKKTAKHVFSTGLICDLQLEEKKLVWANAGHMDPVVIRDGKHMPLKSPARRDIPLGGLKRWNYSERSLDLKSGDLVLLYTDGLDEATNSEKELYGSERLIEYAERRHQMPPAELVTGLLREVKQFEDGAPRHDDITLIALKVVG